FYKEKIILSINSYNLEILNCDLLVTHLSRHLLSFEYLARIRCSTVRTSVTMELGTMSHRSSALAVTLDRALESFTFGDCCRIDVVAFREDISLDLLRQCIFLCIVKSEL